MRSGLDEEGRDRLASADAGPHFAGGVQGLGDGDIHVEIAVGTKAANKSDASRCLRTPHIFAQHRFLVGAPYRVVGDVIWPAEPAEFPIADRAFVAG